MIAQFSTHSLLKYKPGGFSQSSRFFILLFIACAFIACNSHKNLTSSGLEDSFSKASSSNDVVQKQYKADALFMDAVNAKMQDDKENAFRIFSQLAAIKPENATVHYELSRLWLDKNNFDYSLIESKKAVQLDSNNKWIQIQYADLLAYNGSFLEAASIYNKIATKERSPEEYLIRQATLLIKAKKYDEALKVYDQLGIYLGEDDETLILQRQQLFLSKNDVEGAANEVRKLVQYYPNDAQYAILLAAVYENNNLKDKAVAAYEDMGLKFPNNVEVQSTLLRFYLRNKDLKNVMKHLEVVVLNQKLSAQERTEMLLPFVQSRNLDSNVRMETMELIQKFAAQEPPQKQAVVLLADVMVADGNLDEALQQYKKAITIDSSEYSSWQQVMYIYSIKAMQDSAIAYGRKAVVLFPDEYMPYYLGGLSYAQKGDNANAIVYLKNAVLNVPHDNATVESDVLIALGDVYNSVSNFAGSDSCYDAALLLQPNNPTALNNYGYYLSVRGVKLDKAEKMSAKSLRLRPNEANFLDTYGWILFRQGKFKEAKDYIDRAIEKTGASEDATSLWEHLGDVEYKLGNKDKALEHWQKAASLGMKSDILQQKIKEQNWLMNKQIKLNKAQKMSFRKVSIACSSVALLLSLEACHTTKKVTEAEVPKTVTDTAKKEVLHAEDFLNKNISWNSFNGKTGMHYEQGDKDQDLSCNLKMKKDKEIWASLIALGLIEAARAKVTPDSLQAIYKIDKTAYALSFKEGQELIGAQVEFPALQRLFIGNPLISAEVKVKDFEVLDSTVKITQVQDGFTQVLTYDKKRFTLTTLQLSSTEKQFDCHISYENYSAITLQQPFSYVRHIIIHNKGKEIKLDLDFSRAELDTPVETNFSIPSNYERAVIPKKR